MAEAVDPDVLRPSLLERLIGDGSDRPRGLQSYVGFRELREEVGRHLEWLLNTKRFPLDLEAFEEARESLLSYGVPDLSVYSWSSPADARRISTLIEETIQRFEPRLAPGSIKVELLPRGAVDDFQLRFRIDALLHVEPVHEPVSFDTEMDSDSGAVTITGSS